jgi:hypothetical protein
MSGIEWKDGAVESTASMGPWFVRATSSDWAIFLDDVGAVRRGMRDTRAENKAAIVAALAVLRVIASDDGISPVDVALAKLRAERDEAARSLASSGDRRDWDGSDRDGERLAAIELAISALERAKTEAKR